MYKLNIDAYGSHGHILGIHRRHMMQHKIKDIVVAQSMVAKYQNC